MLTQGEGKEVFIKKVGDQVVLSPKKDAPLQLHYAGKAHTGIKTV